jgi:hypothetical protein
MKQIMKAALAMLALGTSALALGASANAAVTFTISVNTSSQFGQAGYIDLQFGAGCLGAACSPQVQPAFASVSNFVTDGTLRPFDAADPNDLSIGATGTLPGGVRFDNQTATPADFSQGLTFGNSLRFDVTLSGAAIESPVNDGGNYIGTAFFLSFGNGDFSEYLFSENTGPFGSIAAALHIQQDGSVLAVANPSGEDYTQSSGLSFATIAPAVAAVPEPASWAMMVGGFGLIGAAMRRRRVSVRFA